jgi:putative transposase
VHEVRAGIHLRRRSWQGAHGDALDILMQQRRERRAAARFFARLLKGQGCSLRRIVTDKLGS